MDNFLNISFVELGIFILGLGYLITYYKQGGNRATSEVIIAYREQVTLNAEKISNLTHEVGILTGQLKEKEERIKVLEGLVKVTPEQQQYMIDMRKFTEGVTMYMDQSTKLLNKINNVVEQRSVKVK